MIIRPVNDDLLAEHISNIRAQTAELSAQRPTLEVFDNLDDPEDRFLEIRGLSEDALTKAEMELRTQRLSIRRSDGTQIVTVLTVGQPVIRTRTGQCYPIEDHDGTLSIVIP